MKVAFISVYGIKCGVATYNEALLEHLKNHCEIKVFAEKSEEALTDTDFVVRCWDRNSAGKKELIQALKEYKPDLIHISHEYGFFPRSYYFTLLMTRLLEYKTIVTLHSVYNHLDKTVQEALMPNIICHSFGARQCLLDKGLLDKDIKVIPHGIKPFLPDCELLGPLWNTWGTQTIVHPGFLLGYKGHAKMLDVVNILRQKYPDIHYVILGSENALNQPEHDDIYIELIKKIDALNLADHVTIHRGFIAEEIVLTYIRTATVVALPYNPHPDHNVYASSGIARLVLGTATPLVVSDAHLFDDIKDLVPHSDNNEELANHISYYFDAGTISDLEKKSRKEFLETKNWKNIADLTYQAYLEILNRI